MPNEAVPTFRALARNANAFLDEMYTRKIPQSTVTVRRSVKHALDEKDLEWLQELITTMQNRIQADYERYYGRFASLQSHLQRND